LNKENKEKVESNVCLIKDCDRLTHENSKYCIFHASAEEKTEKYFKRKLKEYINKIKKEDGDYDFKEFIFVGDINFKKDLSVITFKNADFSGAIFKNNAVFTGTNFEKYTRFCEVTFKSGVYFSDLSFEGNADFRRVTFESIALFRDNVTFIGIASFDRATFKGNTYFEETTFKSNAQFIGAKFKSEEFQHNPYFGGVDFEGNVNFVQATFPQGKALYLSVKNRGIIEFSRTFLENVILLLDLEKGTLVNFNNTLLRNTEIERDQIENHILQEENKEFFLAKRIYLNFKNNFHSIGRYDDESWAFKKEKDMERKSYFHLKSLHKWLWSCFLNAIYGYGEKPERVIVSAIAIIIIFAFVFMNFGIDANPQLDTIPKYNILKELFMGIRYGDLLVRLKDISLEQIKNCLYFSTVTFTTLGLGDFLPVESWGRIFVGAEAFIGALMMALFIYTFARRTGGR